MTSILARTTTAINNNPKITPGANAISSNKFSAKSAESTAKGSNTFLYFTETSSIGINLISWDLRKMYIYMMEYDYLNADDQVKKYTISFLGRAFESVAVQTLISGDIEAIGDDTAELYLTYQITKHPSDVGDSGYFFKHYFGID
ncbi:MAG: hypothetical protein LRY32_03050 [Flavobacterium sp.]|nr:hypothetical protein [Flavobacterium sp.]